MPSFPQPAAAVARPPPSSTAGLGAQVPASSAVVPPSASMMTGGPIPSGTTAASAIRHQGGGGVHQQHRQRKNSQQLPVRGSNFGRGAGTAAPVSATSSTSTSSSSTVHSSTPAPRQSSSSPTLVPQPVGYDSRFDTNSASAYAVPPGYLGGRGGDGIGIIGSLGVGGEGGGLVGQQQRPFGGNGRVSTATGAGPPAQSNGEDSVVVDATSTMMESASRLTVSSCRCPHLDAIFPRLLSSAGMGMRGRLGSWSEGSRNGIDIGGTLALHGMHLSTVPMGGGGGDDADDGHADKSSDRWLYDEEARAVSLACGTDVGSYLPLPPQPVPRLPSGLNGGDGATVAGGGGSSSSATAGGIHPPPLAGGGGAGGPVSSPSASSVRPPFSPGTPTKQPRPSVTSIVGEGVRARTPPPSPPFVACCEDEEETEKEKSDPKRDGGDDRGGEGSCGGAGPDEEEKFLLPEERYRRLRLAESIVDGEVGRARGDRTKGDDDDGDGERSGAPQPAMPSLASLAASFASKKKTGGGLPPPIPSSSSAAAAAAASDPTGRTGGVSKRPRLGTGRDDENHHRACGDAAPAAAFAAEEAVTVATMASVRGEEYLERVRGSRESYWTWWRTSSSSSSSDTEEGEEREEGEDRHRRHTRGRDVHLRCGWCDDGGGGRRAPSSPFPADGDEIMQCLDCGVIGCGPRSTSSTVRLGRNKRVFKRGGRQHLIRHFVATGHSLGITCGPRADLLCMRCGDFVYHELFDRETLRAEVSNRVPWLGWGSDVGPLRRSFGPSEFLVVDSSSSSSSITANPGGATPSATASATVEKGGKLVPSNGGIDSATVVWPGMVATYPMPHLSPALVVGGLHSLRRLRIFGGELDGSLAWGPEALRLGIYQLRRGGPHRWKIRTPVGMYNLGNTCFMSCVLQCLLHCEPLQSHFLCDVGHHHVTCEILRAAHRRSLVDRRTADDVSFSPPSEGGGPSSMQHALVHPSSPKCPASWGEYCLACEMDRLFLETYGSSVGIDAVQSVSELPSSSCPSPIAGVPSLDRNAGSSDGATSNNRVGKAEPRSEHSLAPGVRGTPLVPSRLLTAAWRCGGMDHLAGYEQRDAHEFLQGFLDIMAKHAGQNRRTAARLRRLDDVAAAAKNEGRRGEEEGGAVGDDDAEAPDDVVTSLFQGQLRSVLICEKCGCKRSQPEPFLNISLPISKDRGDGSKVKIPSTMIGTRQSTLKAARMNLQMCLEQFTTPEALADPVHCHWCNEKTPTQKQLTFAKLPRVLCLHLKRFDARTNKKINDPVTFPVRGLDMGRHLPYWCEVVKGVQSMGEEKKDDKPSQAAPSPHVLYDLFGIINHTGSLHQGHYLAHVKVQEKWYHCNDAFVSDSGGLSEKETDGAYMLFYIRREK